MEDCSLNICQRLQWARSQDRFEFVSEDCILYQFETRLSLCLKIAFCTLPVWNKTELVSKDCILYQYGTRLSLFLKIAFFTSTSTEPILRTVK